jgi:hypothetical protein
MNKTTQKLKKSTFKKIATILLLSFMWLNLIVYAEECIGEQCSVNMTINITAPPEEVQPEYMSSPIYQTLHSAGTGFAILMSDAGSGLGVLVVGIILVVIVGVIIYALTRYFIGMNIADYFKGSNPQ